METFSPPHPAIDLSAHLYYQLVYTLTGLLPPPIDDTSEALRTRNHAAIAKVAALLPVNANESDLAPSFACSVAQCIAARAQAEDILRLLRQNAGDILLVMRLNAQYGSMVRTSLSVHGRLMRIQALRQKRAAIDGAANEDARAQHIAERSMLPVVDPDTAPRQATSPEAAPAKLPAAAPAADVDQRTQKPVSENGINSQGAAFETSLSAQLPARGGVRTKNGTGLHEAVREAMAEPRSAGREPPPHLQHAATVAATQKRGDEAQLRPPALPTQTRQDRQNQEIWATAMAEVAGEYTTDLPNLLPAERKVASLRASALSSCANELLSGSAPGLDLPARRAAA